MSSMWLRLQQLRVNSTGVSSRISVIVCSDSVIFAGSETGDISLWGLEASGSAAGACRNVLKGKIQGTLPAAVSAASILDDEQLIFIGTSEGHIFVSSNWLSGEFKAVPTQAVLGVVSAVKYFLRAPFESPYVTTTALYVLFASGHLVVLDMLTLAVIAFSGPCFGVGIDNSAENCLISFACVLDSKFTLLTSGSNSEGGVTAPKYVLCIRDRCYCTYDLSRLSFFMEAESSYSPPAANIIKTQEISYDKIIAATVLQYVEEATRFFSAPVVCLTVVDDKG